MSFWRKLSKRNKEVYVARPPLKVDQLLIDEFDQTLLNLGVSKPESFLLELKKFVSSNPKSLNEQVLQIHHLGKLLTEAISKNSTDENITKQLDLVAETLLKLLFSLPPNPRLSEDLLNVIKQFPSSFLSEVRLNQHLQSLFAALTKIDPGLELAYCLDAFMEHPFINDFISKHVLEVIRYYTIIFSRFATSMQQNHEFSLGKDEGPTTIEVLKVFLVVQTRLQGPISSALDRLRESPDANSDVFKTFRNFLDMDLIYLRSSIYPKEAVWALSLSLMTFIMTWNASQTLQDQALEIEKLFFKSESNSKVKTLPDVLLGRDGAFQELFQTLSVLAQIYTIRGAHRSSSDELLLIPISPSSDDHQKSLLMDRFFPIACSFCENSTVDRFMRFVAIQNLEDLMDRIHNMIKAERTRCTENIVKNQTILDPFEYFFQKYFEYVLEFVWKTWEDPFDPVVDSSKQIFSTLLDIFDIAGEMYGKSNKYIQNLKDTLIPDLTKKLLSMAWDRAKYNSLAIVFQRVGAKQLLNLCPDFPLQLYTSMTDIAVQSSASHLLESFLEALKKETPSDKEQESYSLWMPSFVEVLCSPSYTFHDSIVTHALPTTFKVFPNSLRVFLKNVVLRGLKNGQFCAEKGEGTRIMRSLLSVLKIGRKQKQSQLITAETMGTILNDTPLSMGQLVEAAMTQEDEPLTIDGLELVCLSSRDSEEPSSFERSMMKLFISRNLKTSSNRIRHETVANVRKFLQRLKEATRKQAKEDQRKKISGLNPLVQANVDIVNWMATEVMRSLYPGSPFSRQQLATQLFGEMIDIWGPNPSDNLPVNALVQGYSLNLFSPQNTLVLLHSLWDRFDSSRHIVSGILRSFPAPLPGLESPDDIGHVLKAAIGLLHSPKSREGETGAFIFLFTLRKYVKPFGYRFSGLESGEVVISKQDPNTAIVTFVEDCLLILKAQIASGAKSLEIASRESPMHGAVLTIRYLLSDIDFAAQIASQNSSSLMTRWRSVMETILQYVRDVVTVTFPVVADLAPEGYSAGSFDCSPNPEYSTAAGQLVTVMSWNCIKEVANLLGAIATTIPFPKVENDDKTIVSIEQVTAMGKVFLDILTLTRHVGAIEKSHVAFHILCETLIKSNVPSLYQLLNRWIDTLLESIHKTTQITRRSAGLPYAFGAILKSEVLHKKKNAWVLLNKTMNILVTTAKDSSKSSAQVHAINVITSLFDDRDLSASVEPWVVPALMLSLEGYRSQKNSCSMFYAALIERSVHSKRKRDDHARSNGTTFMEFFARFPSLYEFLLQHLQVCSQEDSQASEDQEIIKQSSLYALLLLLSKLYPSVLIVVAMEKIDDNEKSEKSPKRFVPLVVRCASKSNFMVRTMASMALVPLVPTSDLRSYLDSLATQLSDGSKKIAHNEIHGALLQVQHLLRGHIDASQQSQNIATEILSEFMPILAQKKHLLVGKSKVISCLFLEIIREFYPDGPEKVRILQNATQNEPVKGIGAYAHEVSLAQLQLENLERIRGDASNTQRIADEESNLMSRLLRHRDYEVRHVTLKFLHKKILGKGSEEEDVKIHSELLELLFVEKHHQVFGKILKIFREISGENKRSDFLGSMLKTSQQWETLWQLIQTRINSSAKSDLIQFAGYYFRTWCENGRKLCDEKFSASVCKEWTMLIQENSNSDQMLDLRDAASISISRGLLINEGTTLDIHQKEAIANGWLICFKLLQDEDEDLRNLLARFVSSKLEAKENIFQTNFKPSYAQEIVLRHLRTKHTDSPALFEFLRAKLEPIDPEEGSNEAKKLFEKEEDNNHEEEVIVSQLVSHQMIMLIKMRNTDVEWIRTQISRSIDSLKKLWSTITEQKSKKWTKFVTFKPDVFLMVYKATISYFTYQSALTAATKETSTQPDIISQVLKLDTIHPIIATLLAKCAQLTTSTSDVHQNIHSNVYFFMNIE